MWTRHGRDWMGKTRSVRNIAGKQHRHWTECRPVRLEEQVVEELPDGGHVAAVAVSVENNTILYWQVYDLKKIDTISFYQILDLLRDTA